MSSAGINPAKPYSYWVHCNRCGETFMKKNRSFMLLACGHINCQQCQCATEQEKNGPRIFKCNICMKVTRAVEINNAMPRNLKDLFHPEPYLDGLNSFEIIKFQTGHRRRYFQYLEKQANMTKEASITTEKHQKAAKNTFQKLQQATIYRKQAEKRLMTIQQQIRDRDNNSFDKSHNRASSSSSTWSPLQAQKKRSEHGQIKDEISFFSEVHPSNSFFL